MTLSESKRAQARDTEALHVYLSALEKNDEKLLRTLGEFEEVVSSSNLI
jgi:uncharacterized protein YbjT (DUF2867 family)